LGNAIRVRAWLTARLVTLARVYLTALTAWALARLLLGDRSPVLYMLNALAEFYFWPLPAALVIGLAARRREVWAGSLAGLALFAALYGRQWLPKPVPVRAAGAHVVVMTSNLLGFNDHAEAVVAALRAANADVVALQELNPVNAAAIAHELRGVYPYQVLDPLDGVEGSGVISRFPLRRTGETLPGPWVGIPHVLALEVEGQAVTFVRFHAWAGVMNSPMREQQARALAAFAAAHAGPLIVAGDLNAAVTNAAYTLLAGRLQDGWPEAGWGFGHTFPGAASFGSSRPVVGGVAAPMWMVRIDYVFHSDALTAVAARLGPHDGYSDHRPVMVELVLKE
jgi:endonuclease/exonuclease/phosphatase (EEP) superfamily protein YafD